MLLVEAFSALADDHHEERDEGAADSQDQGGMPVGTCDHGQHGQGDQCGQRHLGQITAVIGLKGLHRIHHGIGQIAGPPAIKIGRPQGLEMAEQLIADFFFDAC